MKPTLLNLCPNDNKTYSPVPAPPVLNNEELTPLTVSVKKIILGAPGRILACDQQTSTIVKIAGCKGQPTCAMPNGNDKVVVMDPDGNPVGVDTGTGKEIARPSIALRFYTYETGQVTAPVAETSLSEEYGPGEIDNPADAEAILTNLRYAYECATYRVAANRTLFQPVICSAEIIAPDNTTVYRSPDRLILPPAGVFGCRPVSLTMDSRSHVARTALTVPTYSIGVDVIVPEGTDLSGYKLIYYQSPQIHTCGPVNGCTGTVSVVRSGTAGVKVLASFPGGEYGLSESEPERSRHILQKLLSAKNLLVKNADWTIRRSDSPTGISGLGYAPISFDDEFAAIKAAVDAPVPEPDLNRLYCRLCLPPHTFTAVVCASSPAAAAWGNITAKRFPGYAACEFGAEFEKDTPWFSTATVTFSDGSTARRVLSGKGNMPVRLDPVLSYPDPSAVHIDIVVEPDVEGGVPLRWSADLVPDMSGTMAIGIAEATCPRAPVEDKQAWITENTDLRPDPLPFQGYVAVAPAATPLAPALMIDAGDTVTALVPTTSASGAWDFGRTRFIAFTEGRTALINICKDFNAAGVGTLAATGVVNESAVTVAPTGAVYFARGQTVFAVNGTRVQTLAVVDGEVDRLGYDATRNEIVAALSSGAGPVYHIDPTSKEVTFTTTSPGPTNRWLTVGDNIYVESQSGLLNLSVGACRSTGASVYVSLLTVARVPITRPGKSLKRILWNVEADTFDGNFSLCRTYLRDRRADISRYRVNGRLAAPTIMPVLSRYMPSAVLEVAGLVSADAVIDIPDVEIA